MSFLIREFKKGDREEAARLADMMNKSEEGWPGGFTGGIEVTADYILDMLGKMDRLAIIVAELEGEIIGYCDLEAQAGQSETAYIPLLNARPDYHSKGIGKALIIRTLERTVELGYKRLTLDTWPGNVKAVPLYKKTGFFWAPESDVFMENFIPLILAYPPAAEFFKGQDWYSIFRRDLEVAPDDVKSNGVRVYQYRFQDEGRSVQFTIDKQSGGVTAFENDEFAVSCIVGKEEVVAGLSYPVRWEIANRSGKPARVAVVARGEAELGLAKEAAAAVTSSAVFEAEMKVDPQARERAASEKPYFIESTVVINDIEIPLKSAVRVRQPFAMHFANGRLSPGREQVGTLNVRSHLETDVQVRLRFLASPGMQVSPAEVELGVPAGSHVGTPVTLKADSPGAFELEATPEFSHGDRTVTCRPRKLAFRSLTPGGVEASLDENHAVLESGLVSVKVDVHWGDIAVRDVSGTRDVLIIRPGRTGPPFVNWDHEPPKLDLSLSSGDGWRAVSMTRAADNWEGVSVLRTVTLFAGGIVKIRDVLVNSGALTHSGSLRAVCHTGIPAPMLTVPLKSGTIRVRTPDYRRFPARDDIPKKPEAYQENWCSFEGSGEVVGIIWERVSEVTMEGWETPALVMDVPRLEPQSRLELPPIYVYAGPGDAETVRRHYVQLSGNLPEGRPDNIRPNEVTCARLEQAPLVITGRSAGARVIVERNGANPIRGTVKLRLPAGWSADWRTARFEDVKRDRPFVRPVSITRPDSSARAQSVRLDLDMPEAEMGFDCPVIGCADVGVPPRITTRAGRGTVENGRLTFSVDGHHYGSIHALEQDGLDYLYSSYPTPRGFQWFNPWYGGVYPFAFCELDPRMDRLKFGVRKVRRIGQHGSVWHGLKVRAEPEHRDLEWLAIECEYLTMPGSDVIAVVPAAVNKTTARQDVVLGLAVYARVSDVGGRFRIHYVQDGREHVRKPTEHAFEVHSRGWLAIEDVGTGRVFGVVSPGEDLVGHSWDASSTSFTVEQGGSVAPQERRRFTVYIVLAESPAQMRLYYQALGSAEMLF